MVLDIIHEGLDTYKYLFAAAFGVAQRTGKMINQNLSGSPRTEKNLGDREFTIYGLLGS
jgi:hypothetical protein